MTLDLYAWQRHLRVAQHQEPADLVIRNGRLINVASQEVERVDIAICDGLIVGVGEYPEANQEIDASDRYIAPSFIDGHVHVESSLLWIDQFARAVVPHGTGAVITDPHEIANVSGIEGIRALMDASENLPVDIYFTIPSCVPASPFETGGAEMTPEVIAEALQLPRVVGLGEMMNFPGVLAGNDRIHEILSLDAARRDGHSPGVRGGALNAYALSGMTSDHESTVFEEAQEKLRRGLYLMIREGSTEHNLLDLLPLVDDRTYARCCFASDDRDCATLLNDGHMDAVLRKAIDAGLDPVRAIRMATLHTADYWRLPRTGMIAPGYFANMVLFDCLDNMEPAMVFYRGEIVAEDGHMNREVKTEIPESLRHTVNLHNVSLADLRLPAENASIAVGAISGQIVTRAVDIQPTVVGGDAVADPARDLVKLAVIERHHATGRVGVGLLTGLGLKQGAMATSVAHDAHNIVCAGVNDADMLVAIEAIRKMQGGLVLTRDGEVIAQLALPVAGILSAEPLETVTTQYEELEERATSAGCSVPSPFGLLSFMALSVIPEARVTDQGFVRL